MTPDASDHDGVELQPQRADAYHWLYADAAGVSTDGPAVGFDSQPAAEAWLTENFDELADAGIDAVSLLNGNRVIYGPMPLSAG